MESNRETTTLPQFVQSKRWAEYTGSHVVFPHSEKFFQKKILRVGDDSIFLDIIQYPPIADGSRSWELQIYFDSYVNPIGNDQALMVRLYTYRELNFGKIEADAKALIMRLLNLSEWPS